MTYLKRNFVFFTLLATLLCCAQQGQKRLMTVPKVSEFTSPWTLQLVFKDKGDNLDFVNTYMKGTGLNEFSASKLRLPLLEVYFSSKETKDKVIKAFKPILLNIPDMTFTPSKALYFAKGLSIHEASMVMVSKEAELYKEVQSTLYEALISYFQNLKPEDAKKMRFKVNPHYLPTEYNPALIFAPSMELRDHNLDGEEKATERDSILEEVNHRIENTSSLISTKSFPLKIEMITYAE